MTDGSDQLIAPAQVCSGPGKKKTFALVVSFGSIQRYSSSRFFFFSIFSGCCSPNSYPIDPLSRFRLWLFFLFPNVKRDKHKMVDTGGGGCRGFLSFGFWSWQTTREPITRQHQQQHEEENKKKRKEKKSKWVPYAYIQLQRRNFRITDSAFSGFGFSSIGSVFVSADSRSNV